MFTAYYPDGEVQLRGTYRMGLQTGNWEYFDESGGILTREDFLMDQGDSIREK
jgi:antitoxin component YwqK of YwqJK toxin-antitoxin module